MTRLKISILSKLGLYAVIQFLPLLIAAFLIALGVSSPAYAQGDVTFTALVDKDQLSTDEVLTLELKLIGPFRSANKPDIPQLDDFYVMSSGQSSQFSIINNQMSSSIVYSYRLQPVRSGSLIIPAITIVVGRETYTTEPLSVQVTAGGAPVPQQDAQPLPEGTPITAPDDLENQDFYVEAEVDNPTPYVSQQIIYTFRLFQRINFSSQPSLDWPEFTGFLGYNLSPNNQYNQTVQDQQYLVTEVRRALYPTSTGAVSLEPALLTVAGSFFNQGIQLQTNPVVIDVRPMPVGAPEFFVGAVGQYEIQAWVEPETSKVNEPVSLFVRISGIGNSNVLPDPTEGVQLDEYGWRAYDPQISTNMEQTGQELHGEKLVERLLVPTTSGVLLIPPFSMVYFDPSTEEYKQIETATLEVNVAEGDEEVPTAIIISDGKQDIQVLGADIHHIKLAPPSLEIARKALISYPLYWAGWLIPLCAVVGLSVWKRYRQSLERDTAQIRHQRALRTMRKRIRNLRNADSEHDVYAAIAQALTYYVGDKLDLPSAGLTRDVIRKSLENRIRAELLDRLFVSLDWAAAGRFAPAAEGRRADDLALQALELVEEIEKEIDRNTNV